ncbi:sugar phosphate isomerase/epimerase [Candidatus Poribacteria bacterium]|nr:sugar phosphate isomerase/epimerase [Candidatus Poribacteria bacterium]
MSQIPVGLQMYTVRDLCETDFLSALKQVADIGYQGVELAGTYGLPADELRDVLTDLNLKCAGSHVSYDDLDSTITYHKELGCPRFGGSSMSPDGIPKDPTSMSAAVDYMNQIGENCINQGIQAYFHNHAGEFAKIEGTYILDQLYQKTNPRFLQTQIDVFWVQYAGVDPAAYLRKYPNRCPLVHIKDMDQQRDFTEVGSGTLDWDNIFAACEEVNADWYIVEQDQCNRPSMESAEISFNYFQSRGMA